MLLGKIFESPVYNVQSVSIDKIQANDYNPNSVAKRELDLLYVSIKEDGYTMPIVCYYEKDKDLYTIVDGFHRYTIMKNYEDIFEREDGCLPVVVINKDISDRMASTIRHNRARGKHNVELQANIIEMLNQGWEEKKILKNLGMSRDEYQRLLGLRSIYTEIKDHEYSLEKKIVYNENVHHG